MKKKLGPATGAHMFYCIFEKVRKPTLLYLYCRQLISITELFSATEVSQYVLPLGLALCEDRVSEVRRMAFSLVCVNLYLSVTIYTSIARCQPLLF